ncbi:hypothetical protein E2C01_090676 [Portunus trituberculatus]|uniref:Uncharacterized protein n=1 Tax=Portunus trituberculatus TaxID=210409 RepID=A0A5B7JM00_PORTR|nr:hypothetical protein [Portunus trituberculatus]
MTPENINEELILGKLVCGLPDSAIRHRLLEEGNSLTLDKAITIVQCAEQVAQHSRVFEPCTVSTKVAAVKRSVMTPLHESSASRSVTQCPNCGRDRDSFTNCPIRERQCFSCGKWNHSAVFVGVNGRGIMRHHEKQTGSTPSKASVGWTPLLVSISWIIFLFLFLFLFLFR